jgi:hypothetical protein
MSVITPLARLAASVTCLVCGLCGCGSLYLHNDAAQQATASARSALDKVAVASVFDNEAAYLDDLEKREYAAVADSLSAQRDDSLLKTLEGVGGSRGDGRTLLRARIDGYLESLVCTPDRGRPVRFSTIVSNAHRGVSGKKTFADSLAEQLTTVRSQMPTCVETPAFSSPSGISLGDAIAAVQDSTKDLQVKQDEAAQAKKDFDARLKMAQEALDTGKATQKTFTDLLATVNGDLKDAEGKVNPYLSKAVAKSLSDAIDPLIAVTDPKALGADPGNSRARAALAIVDAEFGVGDAFSKPPRVPHPNALAAGKASLDYVAARAETQLAEIQWQHAALEAQLAVVAQQVYYLSLAGAELESLEPKPALANDEGLEKLLTDKEPATRRAAAAALYYYAAAWSRGFIPARQLQEVSLPLMERRAKLQQSRQAAEAWLGTLKPAVATLAAYGEGGIDPHIVAEFLQVLGVTAVAVGVN